MRIDEVPATADGEAIGRYRSPLGDRRETPVPCWACRQPTFALDASCDAHAASKVA